MASANPNYKNPPSLEKEKGYSQWKNEVQMWNLVTELDKKKRGLALALSLQGKPREVALEINPASLNVDDGVEILIAELDKLFEKDKKDQTYSAYTAFDKYKRENMNMSEYIINFEQKYNKCKKFEMPLPDTVLAFKVLDNAGLSQSDRQLALTACSDLKFDTMKAALNRIFATKSSLSESASAVTVKEESAFVAERYGNKYNYKKKSYPFNGNRYSNSGNLNHQKVNPTINGRVSQCLICGSKYHWVKECPQRQQQVKFTEDQGEHLSETESVNITLFIKQQPVLSPQTVFVTETYNTAVIDTACTKTVCGSKWFYKLFDSLDEMSQRKITFHESKTPFKFGDGETKYSYQLVKIPAKIGTKYCFIEAEVVDCEIPLLLSKESLKRAKTIIDLDNDKVSMFGKQIDVQFTSSGHYCVNILDPKVQIPKEVDFEEVLLLTNDTVSKKKKRDILWKLHLQFCHPSSNRLISLLKSTGSIDSETQSIVNDISSKCVVCHRLQRPQAKPIVGFSHANDFNQIVAMDLHEIDHNFYYLHIIDLFSRLSAAAIIRKKDSQVIVDKFMQIWVGIYGAPEVGVYTDNGGEFNSQIFRDMAENLNMSVKTTAGYSPWSNGVVERHNATLTDTLKKVRESSDLSWETAICWAVNAKNSLLSVHGFSPYQIVYGRNPNLPSTIVNKPPALEGETISKVMGKHLTGLHEARKAFISSESSEKIRRALRKNIRPSGEKFKNGDRVYFLRDNKWKGPGWVIGQDNVVVFVRYGGTYVRVHESRIMRDIDKTSGKSQTQSSNSQKKDEADELVISGQDDNEDDEHDSPVNNENQADESDRESHSSDENASEDAHGELESNGNTYNAQDQEEDDPSDQNIQHFEHSTSVGKLNKDQIISFKVNGQADGREAIILGRAGKASTNKKNWFNIEYRKPDSLRGEQMSIDLKSVQDLNIVDPVDDGKTEEIFLSGVDFKEAQQAELNSWKNHNVYEEVEDIGQQCISTRWVYTLKEVDDTLHRKARLVAKGFEENCLDDIKKKSPTCDKPSLRLILSVIAQKKWKINSVDIKTAFLQGEKIQREVFLRPPKEANTNNKVWKLNKCVYGLADASLMWYERVKKTLIECGGKVSDVDPAVFYWHDTDGLAGILAVHVDDFLWAGSKSFEMSVIVKLRKMFKVGKEACDSFKYIGLELLQGENKITLCQKDYTTMVKTVSVDKGRDKSSTLSSQEQSILRSKVGQLLWLAKQTRPDIAFDIATIASRLHVSTVEDLKKVNKVIRKVQAEQVCLNFNDLGKQVELLLFSDASFGNLSDDGSQGGYAIFLRGENGKINPVTWQSKRIRRVARSTLASEALALVDGVDCVISIAMLFNEMLYDKCSTNGIPIKCYIDNNDLYQAIYSNKQVSEKRLRTELNCLKQQLQRGELTAVQWIPTNEQIANVLTKHGASGQNILDVFRYGKLDNIQ